MNARHWLAAGVSLLSLAALTKLPWGKRLFVLFSAATAAASG